MEILAVFKKQSFVVQNEVFTFRIVTGTEVETVQFLCPSGSLTIQIAI